MATGSFGSASSDRSDGAGAPEIEITPEMEIAGARFLEEHYPEEFGGMAGDMDRLMARELFLAMWRAIRKSPS